MSDQSPQAGTPKPFDLERVMRKFIAGIRHSDVLGIEFVEASPGVVCLRLPYKEALVGNPYTGVLHGGTMTSLLDQACGMSVIAAIAPEIDLAPTLDLRIDYMRAATPGVDVYARAEVFRVTKSVVFSRGIAYQESLDNPVAHCTATFMRMGLKNINWKKRSEGQA